MMETINLVDLQLFANPNTNVTTDAGLSDEMKVYYSDYLIDLAQPLLIHDQWAQKRDIPQMHGKEIEFRKYNPLPKALSVLQEGVTPDGQKISMDTISVKVRQYGNYVTLSDVLQLTAIDNNLLEATELLAEQAGLTLDTITREVLNAGTNVQYGDGRVSSRAELTGGQATPEKNDYLTVKAIKMAVRTLKAQNAKKINGYYIAIIHPDISFDLTNDPAWQSVKQYDPEDLYEGEIGRLYGVRFIETTEAKIFKASNLTAESATLAIKNTVESPTSVIAVNEEITPEDAFTIAGRHVTINSGSKVYTILRATAGKAGDASIELDEEVPTTTTGHVIASVGGGAAGRAVYSTLVFGANAYGTTTIEGGGLQHIVKQLGSGGANDPLNQRATVGWKAMKAAIILIQQYIVRIETASTYDSAAN